MDEYRIEELAREAGVPVRTLRYYQERRLLPPPRRQGRVGWYSGAHLERLRLITRLLERGYRLDGIEELLAAADEGREVTELLGLAAAAGEPWAEGRPAALTAGELDELLGGQLDPELLAEAVELGYIRVEGERYVISSARLLEATVELVRAGIPLRSVLAVSWELEAAFDRMAFAVFQLARTHLVDSEDVAETVDRLRPVVRAVADEHFGRAMDRRIRAELDRWSGSE
ncbi:MerR family transcriptional regulator [Actinocorallia sp. B10E7]|uniref:MerR family transcriptional regulator n=1 Tax=Actinocorallia sp. B10E7 TaxID=3153558 RepID=UPI00325F0A5D